MKLKTHYSMKKWLIGCRTNLESQVILILKTTGYAW
jgi:hypothetical protein